MQGDFWGFGGMSTGRPHVAAAPLVRLVYLTGLVVLVCTSLGAVLTVVDLGGTSLTGPLVGALRAVGTALFIGGGVLQIARWRIDASPVSGLTGTAMLMYGGVALPLTSIATTMSADQPDSMFAPITRLLTTAMTLIVVGRLLRLGRDELVGRSELVELSARTTAAAVGGFALLAIVQVRAPELLDGGRTPYLLVSGTLAAAWLAMGAFAAVRGPQVPWASRMAPVLTSMSVAEILRMPGLTVWLASAALLVAAIGVLVTALALQDLVAAIRTEADGAHDLSRALAEAQRVASAEHAWRKELAHDACNALAGLRATLQTLEKGIGRLDSSTLTGLRAAAISEVGHLEQMITATDATDEDFDVADVVRSVVEVRRATGLQVALHTPPARAHGRPGDLARVLANLLVNAQQHAHGAGVSVTVVPAGDHVEIQVADRGPGLAVEADPFARGVRGQNSTGSGLGLAVARTLMRQQGGDLLLHPCPTGVMFSARLPLSRRRPIAVQRRRELGPIAEVAACRP